MLILGIETSCDETGLAIYDTDKGLLSDAIYSQIQMHIPYGGVVPELASRDHLKRLGLLLNEVLAKADVNLTDIDTIAFTQGPGLVGSLLTGASFAKALAFSLNIPTIPVNHMEGHILAPFIDKQDIEFPFLALLISGGHTQLINVKAIGRYEILGTTVDDAIGEAFDKTAKLMGLNYPGGPKIDKLAKQGNRHRFNFPRPMLDKNTLNFSFSGLKTSVLHTYKEFVNIEDMQILKQDISASFVQAAVDVVLHKCKQAIKQVSADTLVVSGGVSANSFLRGALTSLSDAENFRVYFPELRLCTDNGVMIAFAASKHLDAQTFDNSIEVFARMPIN